MRPSRHSPNRLSETLKYCSSRKKEICRDLDKKASKMQLEILSHLLTMTFIANELGLKVSLRLSKKTQKFLVSQGQQP